LQTNVVSTLCTPDGSQTDTQFESINATVKELSSTCKKYTDVMALKNQLQCHIFNKDATNSVEKNITEITRLLISLQTAAIELQNIEVC